jgi:type II secretory pathway pseudopilin PulG
LIELLVAAMVLALFLVVTDRVFTAIYRAWRITHRAVDLQQNARTAAARFRREIRESQAAGLTCHPDPSCGAPSTQIAFPSARPSDAASVFCLDIAGDDPQRRALESACSLPEPPGGTYAPVWQRFIGYHLSPDGELRRVVQPGPIVLPLAPSSGQVIGTQVAAFTIARSGRRIRLRIVSRTDDPTGGAGLPPQEMLVEDTIELRNAIDAPVR